MISAAVIGCGKIGCLYGLGDAASINTHVKAFLKHNEFELVGVVDHDEKNLNECAKYYNIKNKYTKIHEVMTLRPDVVSICTPTVLHLEHVKEIAKYNPSVIICEKPLSYDFYSAELIVEICKINNIILFVNYIRRWADSTDELIRIIDSEIVKVIGKYSKGLFHTGSHMIDFLNYLLRVSPQVRYVKNNSFINKDYTPSFDLTYGETDVVIEGFDYHNYELFELEIYTKNKIFRLTNSFDSLEIITEIKSSPGLFMSVKNEFGLGDYFIKMLNNVILSIKSNKVPLSSGESSLEVIKICEEVKRYKE